MLPKISGFVACNTAAVCPAVSLKITTSPQKYQLATLSHQHHNYALLLKIRYIVLFNIAWKRHTCNAKDVTL